MPPFESPTVVLNGFKERAEALLVQADRLYVGTSIGNLHIYTLDESADQATLVETKKAFTRRAIDQLGFVKDINSLVVLSESQLTLYPLPAFAPATALPKTKTALSFATYSAVQYVLPDGRAHAPSDGEFDQAKAVPTQFTQLAVGCRRKIIIYSWRDGEAQDVKEAVLPHSPRAMAFFDHSTICLAYAPEYAVFSVDTMLAVDVATPTQTAATLTGMGAFSGLSGYMTLGLGSKPKPTALRLSDKEVMIAKENQAFTIDNAGKLTKPESFDWPAPPEDTAFIKPYTFSVLPSGTVPIDETKNASGVSVLPSFIPTSVVQIRSTLSSLPVQTLPYPFKSPSNSSTTLPAGSAAVPNSTIRLLTASPSDKSPLFLITTPTDRTQATVEGSSIWQFRMKPWAQQIDELVRDGLYADALALLDTLDQVVFPAKEQQNIRIRALNAVSQFRSGKFDEAIDTFIELDFNPAKVVALYPNNVAGRLSVSPENWISLYGGPSADSDKDKEDTASSHGSDGDRDQSTERSKPKERSPSPTGSIRGRLKTGFSALLPAAVGGKDDDTRSISSVKKKTKPQSDAYRSVQTLVTRYLTDRRPKIKGALEAVHINPSEAHQFPFLSETSPEDLFALPNLPLSSLTPEQLLRFAQIVDTALFKSYLLIMPGLLGSLCRLPNWCEVSEVEQELLARTKYAELIDLYNGRKMHDKALGLLRKLSEEETDPDPEDKLRPSVSYLQKLGPEYLPQIFDFSRWIFEQDRDFAFQIFTSEYVELPKGAVADYLEKIDPAICARYIVFLMEERDELSPEFHDRLAEVYLNMTLSARKHGDEVSRKDTYDKLLNFISTTHYYDVARLYELLPSEDLYEARAILLGRLGRHDKALEIYAYRMGDYVKAEEYCKSIYLPSSPTSTIFLTLLRIYLSPAASALPTPASNLLQPALDLISRHSPRIDPVETLQLLPPLVTAQDVRAFLLEALRAPMFDTAVVREVNRARNDQVARRLMGLEARRVKVTDSRICPQCHKRIGTSVIAVHNPRGEVTHYQCREAFSKRINETRRR